MQIRSIGIDLGKTTFHLIALGSRAQVIVRKKFSRSQLLAHTANLAPACTLYFLIMQDGYTELPPGKIASIVTYLEMRDPPAQPPPARSEFVIRQVKQPDRDWYRRLYREVGEPWLWLSRLRLPDDELSAILNEAATDVFALSYEGIDQGLLEFDRRSFPDIEIVFFGVTPGLIGKGAGRALFAHGLALEWERRPQRIWLHTCTSDHPSALPFYQKFGFVAFKRAIGIEDDPRLTGEMPRTASPHIPIIGRDGD